MLAFILRAGRALATAYATSNTVEFPFITQIPTFRPCRLGRGINDRACTFYSARPGEEYYAKAG
eukprot:IDg803t1